MDRAERRRRTLAYAERAQRTHLSRVHRTGPIDCVCEQSLWFFAKRKSLGCGCRRHPKGQPKVPGGMCRGGSYAYHDTVMARIDGRRLCRAYLRAAGNSGLEVHPLRLGRHRLAR